MQIRHDSQEFVVHSIRCDIDPCRPGVYWMVSDQIICILSQMVLGYIYYQWCSGVEMN